MVNEKPKSSSRSWESLDPALSPWILEAVAAMGLSRMTPVQASTIPLFMAHKDVVVEAVTGSGKTLAFLIPVVERLLRLEAPISKHHVGGIILAPTRELAAQTYKVLESLLEFHPPSAAARQERELKENANANANGDEEQNGDGKRQKTSHYSKSTLKIVPQLLLGGSSTPAKDLSVFLERSPNLLVSTPGRLLELLSSAHVHCPQSSFEVLVLDEADRLLDLGFKEELHKILVRLPKQRRTGLFSASISEAVDQIVRVGLRNPVKIAVKVKSVTGKEDQRTPASLQMTYVLAKPSHKLPMLSRIFSLLDPLPQKSIIYFSTCAAVDYFQHIIPALFPSDLGLNTIPLHGKHPPQVRQRNFAEFVNSTTASILLTTDVAARGLDIPAVDLVVQLDAPVDPKAFMHRCGRAGRAGRRGLSILFLNPGREEEYISFLDLRKTPITPFIAPSHPTTTTINLNNTNNNTQSATSTSTSNDDDDNNPNNTNALSIPASAAADATRTTRSIVLTDRAYHDKAQRAFVSWVRAYTQHQVPSIFRITDQDWDDLACHFGLLRMPRMPELAKSRWAGDQWLGLSIDWAAYGYKDKVREKRRREKDEEEEDVDGSGSKKDERNVMQRKNSTASVPWSEQIEKKGLREKRREKKSAKRERERWEKMTPEERAKEQETAEMVRRIREERQASGSTSSSTETKKEKTKAKDGAATDNDDDDAASFGGFDD